MSEIPLFIEGCYHDWADTGGMIWSYCKKCNADGEYNKEFGLFVIDEQRTLVTIANRPVDLKLKQQNDGQLYWDINIPAMAVKLRYDWTLKKHLLTCFHYKLSEADMISIIETAGWRGLVSSDDLSIFDKEGWLDIASWHEAIMMNSHVTNVIITCKFIDMTIAQRAYLLSSVFQKTGKKLTFACGFVAQ